MKKANLIGQKFNRLTVIGRVKRKRVYWICECDCGNIKEIQTTHLKSGATQSCGCLHKEIISINSKKHGMHNTKTYTLWKNMRQRCNNKNLPSYKNYGGRGIKYCNDWENFEVFKKWCMENGYSEEKQLDRIDNNKGYCPSNCRFTTSLQNNMNRRNTVRVEGLTLKQISKKYNIKYTTVHSRYYDNKAKSLDQSIHSLIASQS